MPPHPYDSHKTMLGFELALKHQVPMVFVSIERTGVDLEDIKSYTDWSPIRTLGLPAKAYKLLKEIRVEPGQQAHMHIPTPDLWDEVINDELPSVRANLLVTARRAADYKPSRERAHSKTSRIHDL